MERFSVEHGRATLVGHEAGDGPAVVLLHAGVADRRVWARIEPALVDGFRVVAYDRRRFGETTYEPEEFSHLDDLVAVLDARGIEDAVLVGNSMGGLLALQAAVEVPERVRALVLIAPAVTGIDWPAMTPLEERVETAAWEAAKQGDVDEANRHERHEWLDGLGYDGRVTGAARELFDVMNTAANANPSPGDERAVPPVFARLGAIDVPTLLVAGSLDVPGSVWATLVLAHHISDTQVRVLDGVAHLPMLEAPDAFLGIVWPWLASLA